MINQNTAFSIHFYNTIIQATSGMPDDHTDFWVGVADSISEIGLPEPEWTKNLINILSDKDMLREVFNDLTEHNPDETVEAILSGLAQLIILEATNDNYMDSMDRDVVALYIQQTLNLTNNKKDNTND